MENGQNADNVRYYAGRSQVLTGCARNERLRIYEGLGTCRIVIDPTVLLLWECPDGNGLPSQSPVRAHVFSDLLLLA